jgi:uncharacterized protein YbcV (DUF1398 family)
MESAMNTQTIADCMKASFADTPFPIVVRTLAGAGVHGYHADLLKLRKTYYDDAAGVADEAMPLTDVPLVAARFDGDAVEATVKSIQRREIGYAEFLRRIMRAGCVSYSVFFDGHKAVYVGRNGDSYTEPFPAAK